MLLRSKIYPTCKYSTIIDATLQDLRIILPSFYHHWCYALRSSLQSPNCNWSSIFYYHWCYAQRSSLQVSNISHSTLKDLLNCPTLLMLRFQILSSLFRHHRCCALRFLLFFSHILPALMLCFSTLFPCFSHCTIIDATL